MKRDCVTATGNRARQVHAARVKAGRAFVVGGLTLALGVMGLPVAVFQPAQAKEAQPAPIRASTQQAADDASSATVDTTAPHVEDEILVTFDQGTSAAKAQAAVASIDGADERETAVSVDYGAVPADTGAPVVVKLDEGTSVEEALAAAERVPGVAAVQPNYRYQLLDAQPVEDPLTNDPALSYYDPKASENAWHLDAIDIGSAWELAKTNGKVTVAVLDTGCDMNHEDLKDNVLKDYAWDAYRNDVLTCDFYGHGTHVAGCVAARAGNGVGTAGSSYNAKILPVNVFDEYGSDKWSSTTKALVDAYDYVLDFNQRHPEYNLHVVNMSLGGYDNSSTDDVAFQQRIAKAKEQGIVSVCAGGNGDGYGNPLTMSSYPSDYDDCFAVTALSTDRYSPTTWCDYNDAKDICAPGEDIYSTVPAYCKMQGYGNWDPYAAVSGTSMATPVTAGVFALLWAARPDLTVDEAVECVKGSAVDALQFADDSLYNTRNIKQYGVGILNASGAVAAALALPEKQQGDDPQDPSGSETQRPNPQSGSQSSQQGTTKTQVAGKNITLSVTLAKNSCTYTGKALKPAVKVRNMTDKKNLVASTDFSVTYASNVNVGTAKVAVKGKGAYAGFKVTRSFKIVPKAPGRLKLKAGKKSLKASWGKNAKASGYQLRYSLKKSMKSSKTKTVKKASTAKLKVKKLKAKKRYYVQVRAYKTAGGKKYYSTWSARKSVKTKK